MLTPMLTLTLLAALSHTAGPVRSDLYSARLLPRERVLAPSLGSRGYDTYSGVKNVVSGSILTTLGLGFAGLGTWGLIGAGEATGSTRTLFTALGWTSVGIGIVLAAVGIPLLVTGIVRLSRPGLALSVTQSGALAVSF